MRQARHFRKKNVRLPCLQKDLRHDPRASERSSLITTTTTTTTTTKLLLLLLLLLLLNYY